MHTKPKLFDCFTFFNELDLLELRLNELAAVVDHFVIAEATLTFTGNEKPLYFDRNRQRFAPFLDKIIHVVVDEFPQTTRSWDREIFQRDCLLRGLGAAAADDILLLSDIDEIPRATTIRALLADPPARNEVVCFELDWHAFFLNVRLREKWVRLGPRAIRMDALSTIDGLRGVYAPAGRYARDLVRWVKACHRMKTLVRRRVIADGGWHFSWFGGLDAIAQKGSSISEHSHVSSGAKTAQWARERMDGLLGNSEGYDLVALDDRFPAFVIAHPEIFGAHVMPVQGQGPQLHPTPTGQESG